MNVLRAIITVACHEKWKEKGAPLSYVNRQPADSESFILRRKIKDEDK